MGRGKKRTGGGSAALATSSGGANGITVAPKRKLPSAPSAIARFVAGQNWPDVQRQTKLARGIYDFSCAGHGGVVAVIGEADLPERVVAVAREEGMIAEVAVFKGNARKKSYFGYPSREAGEQSSWDRFKKRNAGLIDSGVLEIIEVWVGEEDCDWSTILFVSEKARKTAFTKWNSDLSDEEMLDTTRDSVLSWNPDFYTKLTGEPVTAEESSVIRDREFTAANIDNYVVSSAYGSWHETVPEGFVGVTAYRNRDDDERTFLIPKAEYDARQGSFVVDTQRHGAWVTDVLDAD